MNQIDAFNKLLYFSKVGERVIFEGNIEEYRQLISKLRGNKRKMKFKYEKMADNKYLIWREK
jgi:hypothetical protein